MMTTLSPSFMRTLGRILSLLSLMVLLLVGGTFAHANELPHQHLNQSTHEVEHEVTHHDHLSEADKGDTQLNGMHCGADIHCLVGDLNIVFERITLGRFPRYGRQYTSASFWLDPPPPRTFS